MIQSTINDAAYAIEFERDLNAGTINGAPFNWDVKHVSDGIYHVIRDNRTYVLLVESYDSENHMLCVRINGKSLVIETQDRIQQLLKAMGMDASAGKKINELKAPMPGLVLRVTVNEGEAVNKGDTLLVLEAMKMENSIKSPGDGTVSKIMVKPGQAVEKNQLLVVFG
ncbi:MAG: acetyl-CoA carboxylase biotin carboxyl carrier protein subunit [Bacteroidia bacterium]|jgi:biotin carboxyl carrier protein